MIEQEIKTEILKKAAELNLEIFMAFCKLDRYKDKLTEPMYKLASNWLYTLYREEFERMTADYLIERAQKKYEYKKRFGKLVPRESWFFGIKNRPAKQFFKRICAEANKFFARFEKELTAESAPAGVKVPGEASDLNNVANEAQIPEKSGTDGDEPKSDAKPKAPKTGKEKK